MDLTPEIDLAKGIAGQRGAAVIQYIQDFHRRRRARFEEAVLEDTHMEAAEIADRIEGDELLAEVLENGWDAAERTASDYKIRLLARVAAQALTDSVQVDTGQLRMRTFRELDEQDVHALALLARADEERASSNSVVETVEAQTRYRVQRTGSQTGAARALALRMGPDSGAAADAINAALERQGLIWSDPAVSISWGFTDYGRQIVRFLNEMESGSDG